MKELFIELLQISLGTRDRLSRAPSDREWRQLYDLAEEQAIVGVLALGIDRLPKEEWPPKAVRLQWIGMTRLIEQKNLSMNAFIKDLIVQLKAEGIDALLIKGQGVAQCYENPLWRSCGDVDLLLDAENYNKAKEYLISISDDVDEENVSNLHLGMTVKDWVVELHGTFRSGLWKSMDREIDALQTETFEKKQTRIWRNNGEDISLPAVNNHVLFVFTHILQHFFMGGIGLRQICDWCMLMTVYQSSIDTELLKQRIREMGLMSEWKAFSAVAVSWLGMNAADIPLYSSARKWQRKASRIVDFILETGNFGHNRDRQQYKKHSFFVYKAIAFWLNTKDSMKHFMIFPKDATKVWFTRLRVGVRTVVK